MNQKQKKKNENICRCNSIDKTIIEESIIDGANTLDKIFDRTQAGVGACGGSCRVKLKKMLDQYQSNGTFPETFAQKKRR